MSELRPELPPDMKVPGAGCLWGVGKERMWWGAHQQILHRNSIVTCKGRMQGFL